MGQEGVRVIAKFGWLGLWPSAYVVVMNIFFITTPMCWLKYTFICIGHLSYSAY